MSTPETPPRHPQALFDAPLTPAEREAFASARFDQVPRALGVTFGLVLILAIGTAQVNRVITAREGLRSEMAQASAITARAHAATAREMMELVRELPPPPAVAPLGARRLTHTREQAVARADAAVTARACELLGDIGTLTESEYPGLVAICRRTRGGRARSTNAPSTAPADARIALAISRATQDVLAFGRADADAVDLARGERLARAMSLVVDEVTAAEFLGAADQLATRRAALLAPAPGSSESLRAETSATPDRATRARAAFAAQAARTLGSMAGVVGVHATGARQDILLVEGTGSALAAAAPFTTGTRVHARLAALGFRTVAVRTPIDSVAFTLPDGQRLATFPALEHPSPRSRP